MIESKMTKNTSKLNEHSLNSGSRS